jgi:hypothetical protein
MQGLVYNNKLLFLSGYNRANLYSRRYTTLISSLDVIERNKVLLGFMYTRMEVECDNTMRLIPKINNQIAGETSVCFFIRKEDVPDEVRFRYIIPPDYCPDNVPHIEISASPCLIDPNIPLRYSLQNAFDGDPSTSYVENTEDDLITFHFSSSIVRKFVKKLGIINGYAENESLYRANNRIRRIAPGDLLFHGDSRVAVFTEFSNAILADDTLDYQIIDANDAYIAKVLDIYRGERYNDTCIAELNILTDSGWLFGDINNE